MCWATILWGNRIHLAGSQLGCAPGFACSVISLGLWNSGGAQVRGLWQPEQLWQHRHLFLTFRRPKAQDQGTDSLVSHEVSLIIEKKQLLNPILITRLHPQDHHPSTKAPPNIVNPGTRGQYMNLGAQHSVPCKGEVHFKLQKDCLIAFWKAETSGCGP